VSDNILSVKNLTVKYISREIGVCHAVNDVSFDVQKGETLGLVGETGAGKTTIALSIMRLLQTPPARVESGEILLDGEDLLNVPDARMRSIRGDRISMIFQDPMTSKRPKPETKPFLFCTGWVSGTAKKGWASIPMNYPGVCVSGCLSPWPWPAVPGSSLPMNLLPPWMLRFRPRYSSLSAPSRKMRVWLLP